MPRKTASTRHKKVADLLEGEGARKSGAVMGVDVAKDEFAHCIVKEHSILAESEIKYTKAGVKSLVAAIKKWKVSRSRSGR
ncbi:MAG: hypothetical protein Q6373_004995 [Candidatus Sigynarchaeota archaeon]